MSMLKSVARFTGTVAACTIGTIAGTLLLEAYENRQTEDESSEEGEE